MLERILQCFSNFDHVTKNFKLPSTFAPLWGRSRWKLKFLSLDLNIGEINFNDLSCINNINKIWYLILLYFNLCLKNLKLI